VDVFAALTRVIPPLPQGERELWIKRGANKQLEYTSSQEALDALEKHFPSPLAGEGQGEGEAITCERSEYLNSRLLLATDSLAERRGSSAMSDEF
jgi:hypothetical protein